MEKEEKYIKIINKRIADHTNQLTFDIFESFDEEPLNVNNGHTTFDILGDVNE